MGSIGTTELLVVLVVALIVLGPQRLPEAARQVAKTLGELRRMAGGFQAELRDAMQAPVDGTATAAAPAPNAPPAPKPLPDRPEDAELP